jgi:hypothetical protein
MHDAEEDQQTDLSLTLIRGHTRGLCVHTSHRIKACKSRNRFNLAAMLGSASAKPCSGVSARAFRGDVTSLRLGRVQHPR